MKRDRLGPQQIAALARLSCCKTAARDYSVIIIAGSIGRYRVTPVARSGEEERELVLKMLAADPDPQETMWKLSQKAGRLIPEGWRA